MPHGKRWLRSNFVLSLALEKLVSTAQLSDWLNLEVVHFECPTASKNNLSSHTGKTHRRRLQKGPSHIHALLACDEDGRLAVSQHDRPEVFLVQATMGLKA